MKRDYHRWHSPALGRDMELLVFGHAGYPTLVFPTSMGRFFEFEDRGMVDALRGKIEAGHLQIFCVDGVDRESWYNYGAHPYWRVRRHVQYENYVLHEVVPFIRWLNGNGGLTVTGCSFGGYHCMNFALRHPDVVTYCVSMSGAFDIHQFVHGYWDDECYFNCPTAFLPNMNGGWQLDSLRHRVNMVLGAGDWDICLGDNLQFSGMLNGKGVPHTLDIWGYEQKHDWPLWQRMVRKFL
ncbi:MAG: alpha/beta hydrolase-fold protein [Bryobacteraceae bacterium]|nr:alpha/beta hydrolase-fold protein [Bryobacteraceae bacterium]